MIVREERHADTLAHLPGHLARPLAGLAVDQQLKGVRNAGHASDMKAGAPLRNIHQETGNPTEVATKENGGRLIGRNPRMLSLFFHRQPVGHVIRCAESLSPAPSLPPTDLPYLPQVAALFWRKRLAAR